MPAARTDGHLRVAHLTRATDAQRPKVCQGCLFWQTRAGGREPDRERWMAAVEDASGPFGKLYLEDDRRIASLQYAPASLVPRGRDLPAGPPSDDAIVVTCAYLDDPTSPWALQSLFLAAIGEVRDARRPALEAFALRLPPDAPFAERFLAHRTLFPREFLADFGFRTLRSAGQIELMRLDVRGLVPVDEPDSLVAEALRSVRRVVQRPRPAAQA